MRTTCMVSDMKLRMTPGGSDSAHNTGRDRLARSKCSARNRCHHLVKTCWGWRDQQLADGTVTRAGHIPRLSEHPLAAVDVNDRTGDSTVPRRAQERDRPRQLLGSGLAPDGDGGQELLCPLRGHLGVGIDVAASLDEAG